MLFHEARQSFFLIGLTGFVGGLCLLHTLLVSYDSLDPTRQLVELAVVAEPLVLTSPSIDLTLSLGCNLSELMRQGNFSSLVQWDHQEKSVLSVAGCNLSSVDANLARECLATHAPDGLLMIGDSLTRYQYLNLAYFLETGDWLASSDLPNENEKRFTSWNHFYQVTNERMGGHEICDCFRSDGWDPIEHRYFDDGDTRVAYRQIFGRDTPIHLHYTEVLNLSSCRAARCRQGFCAPGMCSSEVQPLQRLGKILEQLLVQTHPSSLVLFNSGLWWLANRRNSFTDHRDVLLGEVLRLRGASPGLRLHWKMTTSPQEPVEPGPEFVFVRDIIAAGAFDGVFDTWSLTASIARSPHGLMWDNSHFEPRIYEGLNRALIA